MYNKHFKMIYVHSHQNLNKIRIKWNFYCMAQSMYEKLTTKSQLMKYEKHPVSWEHDKDTHYHYTYSTSKSLILYS